MSPEKGHSDPSVDQGAFSMKKVRILLVQNIGTKGNGTRELLASAGYEVLWAGSGLSALITASHEPFDLVMVDTALPGTEGMDLCRRFRSNAGTRAKPIILTVGRGFTTASFARTENKPDEFLEKPFTEQALNIMVAALLDQALDKAVGEQASAPASEPEPKAARRPVLRLVPRNLSGEPDVPTAEPEAQDSIIDPTAGLFSRPQFEAMFSKEFKKCQRFKQHMSCMMIDLDGSTMGRKADEALVKSIIGLVQSTIREVDTIAWWTGESFVILFPNTLRSDAVQAAARVLEAVAIHPFTWPDATRVTMSIGVAGLPDPLIDTEQKLLDSAVDACSRALEGMDRVPKRMERQAAGRKVVEKKAAG